MKEGREVEAHKTTEINKYNQKNEQGKKGRKTSKVMNKANDLF
jgi:hypothetical protein